MPDANRRSRQVANAIREELVTIARKDINDPRLEKVGMVTFASVELAADLRNATVWVSFMGRDENSAYVKDAIDALNSASGFIHRLLLKRIPIKIHPHLHFKYDKSFDRASVLHVALNEAAEVEKEYSKVKSELGDLPEPKYRVKKEKK